MMINVEQMVQYAFPILIITLVTLLGKILSAALGALASGQPLKHSVQVGFSMAQIGEFAFIVATLGLSLNVISDFLFPVAVGVSAITTFTTPYLIKVSEPFYNWLVKVLPEKWLERINDYSSDTQSIQAENGWKVLLQEYMRMMLMNGIVVIGIYLLYSNFIIPMINDKLNDNTTKNIIGNVLPIATALPFLWAFMVKRPNSTVFYDLLKKTKYNRGPLLMIEVFRVVLGILIIGFFLDRFASTQISFFITIPIAIFILFLFSKRIRSFYDQIELRFVQNLNTRENQQKIARRGSVFSNPNLYSKLAAWDVHIIEAQVNPNASYIGKFLVDLQWREDYGINIGYIKRGQKIIHSPNRFDILMPNDKVGIISTDEQMLVFEPVFNSIEAIKPEETKEVKLGKILINENSPKIGVSIKASGIREKTNGLVIAIRRGDERILNPNSSEILQQDDIVWVVGDLQKIEALNIEI